MGLLAKLFGAVPRSEMDGIRLDMARLFWEISGETDFPSLFAALADLLPEGCVLYFERGSPSGDLEEFLQRHRIPERAHIAYGTIWPRPSTFHVPASAELLTRLADLTRSIAYPELAIHFHAYTDQAVLLEWHDAFTQPMFISGELPEYRVRVFAQRLQMSCKQCPPK